MRKLRRPSWRLPVWVVAILLALALPGCGGGGGSSGPTGPDQSPLVATGLDFTIIPMVANGTVVEFRWSGSGASSHRLEIGSSSGASDVATIDTPGPATSFSWTAVPVGTFYARVRGLRGAVLGAASNEVLVGSIDARQMIDALIFGYGPLAVAGNAAGPIYQDRMEGWQPGTGFEVILGESVPATVSASAEKTVQQIGPATGGAVQAGIGDRRPDPLPAPRPGEVTVSVLSPEAVKDQCRCEKCVGCASTYYLGFFAQRARILVSTAAQRSAVAHELGHVIGLAHIIVAAGVRPVFTMGFTTDGQYSPQGQLDLLDPATIRMLETIYGAGLTAGSSRRQFEAKGLVSPEGAGALPLTASDLRRRGYVVRQEGLETVIVKPVCQEGGAEP